MYLFFAAYDRVSLSEHSDSDHFVSKIIIAAGVTQNSLRGCASTAQILHGLIQFAIHCVISVSPVMHHVIHLTHLLQTSRSFLSEIPI